MASAVLSSRNEQYWGERKVYMRKYPNNPTNNVHTASPFDSTPNPSPYAQNLAPNSSFHKQNHHDHIPKGHLQQKVETPVLPTPPPPPRSAVNESQLFHRRQDGAAFQKDQFHRQYVTLDLASYSGSDLKQLKRKLISDLERVRSLLARIENSPLESRASFHNFQFRPPSIEADHQALAPSAEKQTPKGSQQKRSSGFVARKGKKKRGNRFTSGQDKKRQEVMESVMEKVEGAMMKKCKQILAKLMRHHYSWVFNKPVDVEHLGLHDYYRIIKHPMDLGTVKSRLSKKLYQTPLDFASDVRLTFENAMKYNPKGQDAHTMAETLLFSFEQMFQPEYQKYEADHLKAIAEEQLKPNSWAQTEYPIMTARALPEPRRRLEESEVMGLQHTVMASPSVQGAPVPMRSLFQGEMVMTVSRLGKLPKPKAKDLNKRPMTDEEKSKLGLHLQNIPQDKMEHVVQIVRKRNPLLLCEEDEIEIDIEALDVETLWELDRFVGYYRKAVNKMRRQEIENAALTKLETKPSVSEAPLGVSVQNNKKGDVVEEDVDIGEEIPANNFPPVEIEKDHAGASSGSSSSGSSSSSSDSSTSTSDSGSGSSSGSDSDEDSVQSPFVDPGRASTNSIH